MRGQPRMRPSSLEFFATSPLSGPTIHFVEPPCRAAELCLLRLASITLQCRFYCTRDVCLMSARARERERERHHFPGKSQSLLGSPCVGGAYDQHIVLHGLLELPASGSGRLDLEIG